MYTSIVRAKDDRISPHLWPEHTGERVYMERFTLESGLPLGLERWQPIVDHMLEGIDNGGQSIYLMIDQGLVKKGQSHRRGGWHIDGYWVDANNRHEPRPKPGGHSASLYELDWSNPDFSEPEGIILASDVGACVAMDCDFGGPIGEGGSCENLNSIVNLRAIVDTVDHSVIFGNVSMLHNSNPIWRDTQRSLVRLNVKGWSPT